MFVAIIWFSSILNIFIRPLETTLLSLDLTQPYHFVFFLIPQFSWSFSISTRFGHFCSLEFQFFGDWYFAVAVQFRRIAQKWSSHIFMHLTHGPPSVSHTSELFSPYELRLSSAPILTFRALPDYQFHGHIHYVFGCIYQPINDEFSFLNHFRE
jgi:hypothetical protein